jgi:hypothetical protein
MKTSTIISHACRNESSGRNERSSDTEEDAWEYNPHYVPLHRTYERSGELPVHHKRAQHRYIESYIDPHEPYHVRHGEETSTTPNLRGSVYAEDKSIRYRNSKKKQQRHPVQSIEADIESELVPYDKEKRFEKTSARVSSLGRDYVSTHAVEQNPVRYDEFFSYASRRPQELEPEMRDVIRQYRNRCNDTGEEILGN